MRTITQQTIAAALVLAMAFTFNACSSSDDEGGSSGGGGKGNNIANYKTVQIGEQTWMAENLNYAVEGSKCGGTTNPKTGREVEYEYCYNDGEKEICKKETEKVTFTYYPLEDKNTENCDKYGRLYNWVTAMALPSSCSETQTGTGDGEDNSCKSMIKYPHRGICPSGWHIPSNEDWNKLFLFVDTIPAFLDDDWRGDWDDYEKKYYRATNYLKSKSGWSNNGNGTDDYGFNALPGGGGYYWFAKGLDANYREVGKNGFWWTSSEQDNGRDADVVPMSYNNESVDDWDFDDKPNLHSVRCVKD